MKTYSQLGEDIFLIQRFINVFRSDIIAYEIGAYDGKTYSNTLLLEELSGCRCVLVEPSPYNIRRIYQARPHASIHQFAIAGEYGTTEFVGHSAVAGAVGQLSNEYIAQWKLDEQQKYRVAKVPMSTITDLEQTTYIDFISIDVQGAEFDVLRTFNWNIDVGIVCIELEETHPRAENACRGILSAMGFEFVDRLHVSEFWVNKNYERFSLLFDRENIMNFDSFEPMFFEENWRSSLRSKFL